MKFGIAVFPGTWSDADCGNALGGVMGQQIEYLWHKDTDLRGVDCVVLPGGFSYGDYLRCGAIARFSPIMSGVKEFAGQGRPVIGICNGFQILCEAGLLPGVLIRNRDLKFHCEPVHLISANHDSPFTQSIAPDRVIAVPISHGEGNYTADPATLARLEDRDRVAFRYCTATGEIAPEANPNGSIDNIAGVLSDSGNVLGMMPHPERACEPTLGGTDGRLIFDSIIQSAAESLAV